MRNIVYTATLTALASGLEIAKSYAGFALLSGFEPVTFIVAFSGFLLGSRVGFMVGVLTKLVFSLFLGFYPSIVFDCLAFGLVGILSGFIRSFAWGIIRKSYAPILFSLWGALVSVLFNFISNAGWGVTYCIGQPEISTCLWSAVSVGLFFNIKNIIWNIALFSLMPLVMASSSKFKLKCQKSAHRQNSLKRT